MRPKRKFERVNQLFLHLTNGRQINYFRDSSNETIEESAWCGPPFNEPETSWEALVMASTILFFVMPTLLLLVLYLRIARTLQHSGRLQRCASSEAGKRCEVERTQVQSRRVVIRMLGQWFRLFSFSSEEHSDETFNLIGCGIFSSIQTSECPLNDFNAPTFKLTT